MATRVELPIEQVKLCLDKEVASLRRSLTTKQNPQFRPIIEGDIAAIVLALTKLTEVK